MVNISQQRYSFSVPACAMRRRKVLKGRQKVVTAQDQESLVIRTVVTANVTETLIPAMK